ncbi:MAG: hypothetical protein LLG01_18600 [Planctomycetaceae bacterium]|nr:hypothetical protein [Planctomycetaceae bacterium]
MSPMVDADAANAKPRPMLRSAVVLLVVLAAAIAAAWTVVSVRAGATRRGTEIVRRLREKGLAHFLGSQPQVHAYLATRPDGRTYGWRLVRIELADGNYAGLIVDELQDGARAQHSTEHWQAAADLHQVRYEASETITGQQTRGISIAMATPDGEPKVTVIMAKGREGIAGQGQAPGNYVPEGMLPLAIRLAAEGGKPANIMLILNNEALVPTSKGDYQPNFTSAQLRPISPREVEVSLDSTTNTYILDERGRIVSIRYESGLVFSAVSLKELSEKYEISQYLK